MGSAMRHPMGKLGFHRYFHSMFLDPTGSPMETTTCPMRNKMEGTMLTHAMYNASHRKFQLQSHGRWKLLWKCPWGLVTSHGKAHAKAYGIQQHVPRAFLSIPLYASYDPMGYSMGGDRLHGAFHRPVECLMGSGKTSHDIPWDFPWDFSGPWEVPWDIL